MEAQKALQNKWFLILFFALAIGLRVIASSTTWLHYDENYYINIAQNYQNRGDLTPYMWRMAETSIISGGGSGYGVVVLIKWLNFVNNSLYWGRVFNIIINALTCFIMYYIASIWWRSKTAGALAFIYALINTSSFYTLILKMDALGILFQSIGLLIFVFAVRSKKYWINFVAGIVFIIAAEIHIISIVYSFAIAIYFVSINIIKVFRSKKITIIPEVIFFFSGSFIAGMVYLLIHVFPDPQEYFLISNLCFECNESVFITEIKRYIRLMVFRPIELIILLMIVVSSLMNQYQKQTGILMLIGGYLLAQALIGIPPYDHYFNHSWLFIAIGFPGIVLYGFKSKNINLNRRLIISIVFSFILLGANIFHFMNKSIPYMLAYYPNEDQSIAYIHQNYSKDVVIMGLVPDFYLLQDYKNFITYRDGTIYKTYLTDQTQYDLWIDENVQIILLPQEIVDADEQLREFIVEYNFKQQSANLWIRNHK